jgi:hypothetical protein
MVAQGNLDPLVQVRTLVPELICVRKNLAATEWYGVPKARQRPSPRMGEGKAPINL